MNRLDHDEVRLRIQAPPELLYDLVSDVPRTPEWSPEVISCRWLDGAADAVPGARFSARNKRRWAAWSNKPVVETAERGHQVLKPVPVFLHLSLRALLGVRDLRADLHQNIATSLQNLARIAER